MNRSSLFLPLLLLFGCDKNAGGPAAGAVVRDSAGIAIVENPLPPTSVEPAVDSVPVFSIGGGVGGPEYDLNEIRGAARLSDGRVVVADNASGELRFFDSTGAFLLRGGRKGKGPGEFEQIMTLWVLPSDSILVYDIATRRLSLFGPGGAFARQVDLAAQGFMAPAGLLDDGSIVASGFSFNPDSMPPKGSIYRNRLPALLIAPDGGSIDTLAVFEGLEVYTEEVSFGGRTFPNPMQVQFGRNTTLGARGDNIYVGDNAKPEIMVYGRDGKLVRIIRTAYTPVTVTEADRKAQEGENLERLGETPLRGMPKEMLDQVEGWIRNAKYSERFPSFQAFTLDRAGNLWVQEFTTPGEPLHFRVYSPGGELIIRTALPHDVRPLDIGKDYVLGAYKDDDGLEHIRLYRTPGLNPQETSR
jgi:hypothetical protein